jgi:hypothetical protein
LKRLDARIEKEITENEDGAIRERNSKIALWGIGHTSYEYIFSKLRSTRARSNMTRDGVNPDEKCDGDHCFHRLMLISNSIYFCFPMDHTTN